MIIHSLLNPEDYQQIKTRIQHLTPQHQPLWGKMNIIEALKHIYLTLKIATGETQAEKVNFLLKIIGNIYRKKYSKDNTPFSKNSPTSPILKGFSYQEFETEKQQLLKIYEHFYERLLTDKLVHYHPFFQKVNQQEWGILQYKHIDHHLRQFGA